MGSTESRPTAGKTGPERGKRVEDEGAAIPPSTGPERNAGAGPSGRARLRRALISPYGQILRRACGPAMPRTFTTHFEMRGHAEEEPKADPGFIGCASSQTDPADGGWVSLVIDVSSR